ncbi:MAG: N-acetyl-gamma-glutamyl-phosphate reductase [Deltaproteobacteria bacterium]|jgi:N-acetyl-gamma-glutamyl-phosphate reductase|nr:N-acetyl-gamma-glutamyl-phosphate reductase [Deltaproteobacteria bacterium]
MSLKIGIVGASGFAGLELLRILANRPSTEVSFVTSRQDAGTPLTEFFPSLSGYAQYEGLTLEKPENFTGRADVVFMATQHGVAMNLVPAILESGSRVIDLSADFRLKSPSVFEQWYEKHQAPKLLHEAAYGLPEIYRYKIARSRLVANPGCYPTSVILALAPLLRQGLIDLSRPIIADSKSGATGAGRGLSRGNSFCEVQDNFKAYKVVGHRHIPEMIQELSALATKQVNLSFTPHLLPINRGILSTIYVTLNQPIGIKAFRAVYEDYYERDPYVRIRPEGYAPETADVRGTNYCDLGFFPESSSGLWKIISVIDNICRGAAGQAVANLNIMTGCQEDLGLAGQSLRP